MKYKGLLIEQTWFIIVILLLVVFFGGDPDLHDALMQYLGVTECQK